LSNGRLMAYLADRAVKCSRGGIHGERVTIHCRLPHKYIGRIQGRNVNVRPHDGNGQVKLDHDLGTTSEEDVEDVA
jgi:hypothetical protein